MNQKRSKGRRKMTIPGTVPIDLYVRNGKIRIDATELSQVVRRAVYDANRDFVDILAFRHPELTIRLKTLLSAQDPLLSLVENLPATKRQKAIRAIVLKAVSMAMEQITMLELQPNTAKQPRRGNR